jgi:flavin reductase (DIM6/NTAB) family NADH-FMN oxidoreductase RutF
LSEKIEQMKEEIKVEDLKKAAGGFATGVTIITSKDEKSVVHGMTASSFVSISFIPPLVSFSIDRKAKLFGQLEDGKVFGISILCSSQKHLSNHFAGNPNKNEHVIFDESKGFPLIKDPLAWFIVKATKIIPAGDHHMVLCSIETLGRDSQKKPLLYFSGKYL